MAWCLLAPSHYLNQSWLMISESQWHQSEHISQEIPQALITLISFKIHCKISFKSPRGQWVNICVKLYLRYTYRQIYTYIDSLSPYLNKVRWQWVNICLSAYNAGTAIVTSEHAALWTDGRYFLQAQAQLDPNWTLMKSGLPDTPGQADWLKKVRIFNIV